LNPAHAVQPNVNEAVSVTPMFVGLSRFFSAAVLIMPSYEANLDITELNEETKPDLVDVNSKPIQTNSPSIAYSHIAFIAREYTLGPRRVIKPPSIRKTASTRKARVDDDVKAVLQPVIYAAFSIRPMAFKLSQSSACLNYWTTSRLYRVQPLAT